MDLKTILANNGVEAEKIDGLIGAINSELHKEFIPKTQYNKKVLEISNLNEKLNDLEALKEKEPDNSAFEALKKEYEDYKLSVQAEKETAIKTTALAKHLKDEGVNEKLISLLAKEFDLDKLEVEGGQIKDWEVASKDVRENYSDFFTQTDTKGATPNNPPETQNGGEVKEVYIPPAMI